MRLLLSMADAALVLVAGAAASCGCDGRYVDASLRRILWRRRVDKAAAVAASPRTGEIPEVSLVAAGEEAPCRGNAEMGSVAAPGDDEVSPNADRSLLEFRALHDQYEEGMVHHPCNTFGSERRILDCRIVPLRNFAELRAAGRRMCNHLCVADPECRPEHAWFVMLDGEGWAVAMFRSLGPTDRFDPANMRGLCDMPVPGNLEMMAKLYLWHEYWLHTRTRSSGEPGDSEQRPDPSGAAS